MADSALVVDLARYGYDDLHLHAWPSLSAEEVQSRLASAGFDYQLAEGGLHARLVGGYTRHGDFHLADLTLRASPDKCSLVVDYELFEDLVLPSRRRREYAVAFRRMVEFVKALKSPCTVIAQAFCGLDETWKSSVALPIVASFSRGEAFDEVRGMRLVKNAGGREVESTVIDMETDGTLNLHTRVTYETELTEQMPAHTLSLLNALRAKMTIRVEEDER